MDSVTITAATPPPTQCTRAKASIVVEPQTQTGAAGEKKDFTLTLKNNDTGPCASSVFSLSQKRPTNWSGGLSTNSFTLAPGATGKATLSSKPPTGTAVGAYTTTLTLKDNALSSHNTTAAATYEVIIPPPDTTPPTVTLSPPSGSVTSPVTLTAEAQDNVKIAKVEFYRTGALVRTDSASPYTYTWSPSKVGATHTFTAKAYDAAGNVGASPPITLIVSSVAFIYNLWQSLVAAVGAVFVW